MTHFDIDIVSDTVCPWCYIGLRNLKSAIAQRRSTNPDDTFSLKWHPFQLNPRAPKGQTVDKRTSYVNKLGVEGARVVFDRIRSAGENAGINFSFNGRIGNTLDSHRLIELAGRQQKAAPKSSSGDSFGLQTLLVEELFADYFEREQDITSHDVLSKAAVRAGLGMEDETFNRFLSSDELASDVRQEADAQRQELNGVPLFILNDDYQIEGAQEPIAFLHLFNRLVKKGRAAL